MGGIREFLRIKYDKCLELGFAEEINQVIAPSTGIEKRILVIATTLEAFAAEITLQSPQRLDYLDALPDNILEIKYLNCGKKDKLNKIDIVGFLSHKGKLAQEDIGLIEVKDFIAFAAIRRKKANTVLPLIEVERIKGKKPKVEIV